MQRQPDIDAGARACSAGSRRCTLDEGLKKTIAYFDELLSRRAAGAPRRRQQIGVAAGSRTLARPDASA